MIPQEWKYKLNSWKRTFKKDNELKVMTFSALFLAIISIEYTFRANEELIKAPILGMHEEFCPHPNFYERDKDDPTRHRLIVSDIRRDVQKGHENIAILGGSETQSYYLSEHQRWPFILEDLLLEKSKKLRLINLANSGNTSFQHVKDLKVIHDSIPQISKAIVNTGIPDMLFALSGRKYKKLGGNIFDHVAIFRDRSLIVEIEHRKVQKRSYDYSPMGYAGRQQRRWDTKKINELPDIEDELELHLENLEELIEYSNENKIELVFFTQPALWKEKLTKDENKRLWTGGRYEDDSIEPYAYYSEKVLAEALDQYNSSLIELCAEHNIRCFDLASQVPKETTVFFDGYHMHESGQIRLANILYKYWDW